MVIFLCFMRGSSTLGGIKVRKTSSGNEIVYPLMERTVEPLPRQNVLCLAG